MKLLFVAAEGAPFAKTGGLGDVIGALPKSLATAGEEVAVMLPYYDLIDQKFGSQVEDLCSFYIDMSWRHQYVGVKNLLRIRSHIILSTTVITFLEDMFMVIGMMVSDLLFSN